MGEAISEGPPMEVCRLGEITTYDEELSSGPDEDATEQITCCTTLALDAELSLQGEKEDFLNMTRSVAIVIGTDTSRVVAIELMIHETLKKGSDEVQMSTNLREPFEPLPLDVALTGDASVAPSMTSSHHGTTSRSRHGASKVKEFLDASIHGTPGKNDKENQLGHPFFPEGGVATLSCYTVPLRDRGKQAALVWISYRDGTIIRLHHASFFPSIADNPLFADQLTDTVLRSRVAFPLSMEDITLMPLPKYYPSPLAPLSPITLLDNETGEGLSGRNSQEATSDVCEVLAYGSTGNKTLGENPLPAWAFFTSEDQFVGRISGNEQGDHKRPNEEGNLVGTVVDGTKSLVGGVIGATFGVIFGGGKAKEVDDVEESHEESRTVVSPLSLALHKRPSDAFSGSEMHDAPRQIISASIDPSGNLAAVADTLGRVTLIDLASKQVVRIWKGVRDASCFWIEDFVSDEDGNPRKKKRLHIAIHSKQRGAVEIWRCRYGPRAKSMKVERDSQIIQYTQIVPMGSITCCYLLNANNQIELLQIHGNESDEVRNPSAVNPRTRQHPQSIQESAVRLQVLRQMLAKTNVPSQRHDVFDALVQITALKDLGAALDILATADQLEEAMGVLGAEFHSSVVKHCRNTLEETIREGGSDITESTVVISFSSKIVYHEQIIKSYESIHENEAKNLGDHELEKIKSDSVWPAEGMAWLQTYETVSGSNIDEGLVAPRPQALTFASFAKACSKSNKLIPITGAQSSICHKIYLSDSTKTRKEILPHLFKPLLGDIFHIRVVDSTFAALGISMKEKEQIDYLLTCFGDWFMSLPAREAALKSFFTPASPLVRWLQDAATAELVDMSPNREGTLPAMDKNVVLEALYQFCSESPDLVRSFLLASLCREAVSIATKKQEMKTYGMITRDETEKPWIELLRKLRITLFVSLRLHGVKFGAFPLTVKHVEAEDIFSVYEWLARDELRMTHKHEENLSLEQACRISGLAFDPFIADGDKPKRWKQLQQSCLAAALSEAEREEYMLDLDDDELGAMLLFLSNHNHPPFLTSHRALLLAGEWTRTPSDTNLLDDCLEAVEGIGSETHGSLCVAVCLEIWQSAIRPIYRALLFGFEDVHELDQSLVEPLLEDQDFVDKVGHCALVLLDLLSIVTDGKNNEPLIDSDRREAGIGWPPVREDVVLKRLQEQSRRLKPEALDSHRIIVCGTLLSDDIEILSECVPSIYGAFTPTSLYDPVDDTIGDLEKQMEFLENAVVFRARATQGGPPFFGRVDLGEVETLAQLWNVDLRDVRTMFLLAMYELGKDSLVDQMVTVSSDRNLDLERFIQDGLGIACRRLDRVLSGKRSPQVRAVIGMLDADTCEWIREESEISECLVEEVEDENVPLSSTHLLILRLLSLASTTGNKAIVVKIHTLSILSGTLMKAMESSNT